MKKRIWRFLIVTALLFAISLTQVGAAGLATDDEASAAALFEQMTVEERIGQLFLVTFEGATAAPDSDIAELVRDFRVGGVALLAENDNITDQAEGTTAPEQVASLVADLQRLALLEESASEGEQPPAGDTEVNLFISTPPPPRTAVPLFVATNYEGDGYPYSSILSGLTQIPSNMAIGATWEPQYAETVGRIVGQELPAIGVNMLLGPSLDVLEDPDSTSPADLGVRVFGGDPYWVGLMGRAYTTGVHDGSQGRLAVIAKHFPGNGSSDRPVDFEVPTVRKSLEQLKQIELAPFLAVTDQANDPSAVADGLLTTHIRYQGFQGNIRATTNPISFDRQALSTLMQLPELAPWRSNGGLMVSDALGVRSVERFFDDTEQEFPHRRVAKDALLAGNDLLYLADFALGDAPYEAQLANIKDTILWFREIYLTDQPFQRRVDEAVLNILRLKVRLYGGDFSLDNVEPDSDQNPAPAGQQGASMFDLAQAATTLISPSRAEIIERLDNPPGLDERIVIFTDLVEARQCSLCPLRPLISPTALEDRILAIYGPGASDQVSQNQVSSFTTAELQDFLDAGPGPIILPPTASISPTITPELQPTETATTPTPTPLPTPTPTPPPAFRVQEALRAADWIIFASLGNLAESRTLNNFLALRPDIVRDARVIVFTYGVPYFLDTTEISKLTAFYAMYSHIDAFIDASARALFQESPVKGAPPIDVPGISYDLFQRTQPDPDQVIELFIINEGVSQSPPKEAPLSSSIGDTLNLQTGVIRDRNGNPVPDGTLVQFIQLDRIQGLISIIAETSTTAGVASLDYVLEARTGAGQFRITAVAGEAEISEEVDISIEEVAQVAIITPTPLPTPVPTETSTPSPTPTITATPTATPSATPTPIPSTSKEPGVRIELSEFGSLLAMMTGLVIVGNVGLVAGRHKDLDLSNRIGWVLWGLIGGLFAYNYVILELPGTASLPEVGGWAGLVSTLVGGSLGLLLFQLRRWLHGR